jgi:integrase
LHLGYRRLAGAAGPWILRRRHSSGYREEGLGTADDLSDADGGALLSYWQAVERARASGKARLVAAAGYTVQQAVEDHLMYLQNERRGGTGSDRARADQIIRTLGEIELGDLTTQRIEAWRNSLARQPARIRGPQQRHRKLDERARRVTANRTLAQLRAALNRAWRYGKVASREQWQRVETFKGVNAARERYLTIAESVRHLNGCNPDFRLLCRAALETGARYGELVRLKVSDFNPDAGMLLIRTSKTGKPRDAVHTEQGIEFFQSVCAGRAGDEIMLRRFDGNPWGASHQHRQMKQACARAKINPRIGFHGLRHTWASLTVMSGVPLFVVAKNPRAQRH